MVGDELVLPWLPGVPEGFKPEAEDGSFLTSAPITPREVRRRYSNGRDFEVVLRKGYRNSGICATGKVSELRLQIQEDQAYR